MGMDVSGKIIFGIRIIKIQFNSLTTRYNEKTGEPYQTVISQYEWRLFEDQMMIFEKGDLEFFQNEKENAVYGICLSSTDLRNDKHIVEFDFENFLKIKDELISKFGPYKQYAKLYNFLSYG
jgi:predicted transcriptional regulator YdeE